MGIEIEKIIGIKRFEVIAWDGGNGWCVLRPKNLLDAQLICGMMADLDDRLPRIYMKNDTGVERYPFRDIRIWDNQMGVYQEMIRADIIRKANIRNSSNNFNSLSYGSDPS